MCAEKTETPKEKVKFLEEEKGHQSSMRLMSFISLFASMGFGMATLWLESVSPGVGGTGSMITFSFLLGAFAPKALQKFAETKNKKN